MANKKRHQTPPLFTAPPHASTLLTSRTNRLLPSTSRSAAHPIPICAVQNNNQEVAISRRAFSTLLASLPLLSLGEKASAGDISGLVTPYKDLPKGFTILRPNGWNEFEGMQDAYDIKWQDVIQPLEFVTVLTTPVGKGKTIENLGSVDEVGKKLAGGRGGELVSAKEKDIDGLPAYLFEIKRDSSHQLTLLAINRQKLYSVNASCSEKRWGKREKLLRGVVDSFKPKL